MFFKYKGLVKGGRKMRKVKNEVRKEETGSERE